MGAAVQRVRYAVIGCGNMGAAMAVGLVRGGAAPETVTLADAGTPVLPEALSGCPFGHDNAAAAAAADTVIVAVKPYLAEAVLAALAPSLRPGALVISVAAGITVGQLRAALTAAPEGVEAVRAMPNLAVALGEGAVAVAGESPEGTARALLGLAPLGLVAELPEALFPAVSALSGCGIAHALRFLRAGMTAGVAMGLRADAAAAFFAQAMRGAAALVAEGEHPEAAIDRVCTPAGLTVQGICELEANGFTDAVVKGIRASCIGR